MNQDTAADRDQWAIDRIQSMLDSGIKAAAAAVQSHQGVENQKSAEAWQQLGLRLEQLTEAINNGLFDLLDAGSIERDSSACCSAAEMFEHDPDCETRRAAESEAEL